MPEFTPTQKRILRVLSDGMCHTKEELHEKCIADELSAINVLYFHISALRKKLVTRGEDIIYSAGGNSLKRGYRHVRLLHPVSDE